MQKLRSIRWSLLALCVAVLQLVLPVSAYAHMASTGDLMQVVCSVSGSKSVSIEQSPGIDATGQSQSVDHSHHCCMCSPPAFMVMDVQLGLSFPGIHNGAIRVGQTFFQHGTVAFQPPATGPPALF